MSLSVLQSRKAAIPGLHLPPLACAKLTPARAAATTDPLCVVPAQVARGLYVAQTTPRPHAAASQGPRVRAQCVILVYG